MARNLRHHRIYDAASTESHSLTQTLITQEPSGDLAHSRSNLTLFIKCVTVNRRVLSEWQFNFRHLNYPLVFKRGANTGEGQRLQRYFHSQHGVSDVSPCHILRINNKRLVCFVEYFFVINCCWFVDFPFRWCHICNMHLREEPENAPHLFFGITRQPISVANLPCLFGRLEDWTLFLCGRRLTATNHILVSQSVSRQGCVGHHSANSTSKC